VKWNFVLVGSPIIRSDNFISQTYLIHIPCKLRLPILSSPLHNIAFLLGVYASSGASNVIRSMHQFNLRFACI